MPALGVQKFTELSSSSSSDSWSRPGVQSSSSSSIDRANPSQDNMDSGEEYFSSSSDSADEASQDLRVRPGDKRIK